MVYGSPLRNSLLYFGLEDTWPLDSVTRPSSTAGAVMLTWLRLVLMACWKAAQPVVLVAMDMVSPTGRFSVVWSPL